MTELMRRTRTLTKLISLLEVSRATLDDGLTAAFKPPAGSEVDKKLGNILKVKCDIFTEQPE